MYSIYDHKQQKVNIQDTGRTSVNQEDEQPNGKTGNLLQTETGWKINRKIPSNQAKEH